jgi:hypothetical protein
VASHGFGWAGATVQKALGAGSDNAAGDVAQDLQSAAGRAGDRAAEQPSVGGEQPDPLSVP